MLKLLILPVLLLCSLQAPATNEQRFCTELGCVNGFSIPIATGSARAGIYKLRLTTEDKTLNCTLKIPLVTNQIQCDHDSYLIVPGANGFFEIIITDTPKQLTIQIIFDDILVFEQNYEPQYVDIYPNGNECDKRPCKQADNIEHIELR